MQRRGAGLEPGQLYSNADSLAGSLDSIPLLGLSFLVY